MQGEPERQHEPKPQYDRNKEGHEPGDEQETVLKFMGGNPH